MNKIATITFATILGCSSSLSTHAQNMDAVLHSIEQNNLVLKALRHSHEAELLDLKADNILSGPSVEYSPFYEKGYSGLAESELIVTQEFDFPTRYAERNRQAKLQHDALQQQWQAQRQSTLLNASLLCLDLIRLNQMQEMNQQRIKNSEAMILLYEKRLNAGDANLLEVNKIKLEHYNLQKAAAQTQNERTTLLLQLQDLNAGQPVTLTATTFPEYTLEPNFDAFLQQALASNTDIQAAEADLRVTQHQLTLAKHDWLPSLRVGYRRNTAMGEAVNGFLVGVNFPLLSTANKTRAARQRQEAAQLALQQSQQSACSNLRSRYNQLVALQQVLLHDDVDMMNATISLLDKALQHGEITVLEYYTESNSIYDQLQSHIDTNCQSAKLFAELHATNL